MWTSWCAWGEHSGGRAGGGNRGRAGAAACPAARFRPAGRRGPGHGGAGGPGDQQRSTRSATLSAVARAWWKSSRGSARTFGGRKKPPPCCPRRCKQSFAGPRSLWGSAAPLCFSGRGARILEQRGKIHGFLHFFILRVLRQLLGGALRRGIPCNRHGQKLPGNPERAQELGLPVAAMRGVGNARTLGSHPGPECVF